MSGPIRRKIGPCKARVTSLLNEKLKLYDVNETDTVQLTLQLRESRVKLDGLCNRLNGELSHLRRYDNEWTTLIDSLTAEQKALEETLYVSTAEDAVNGYLTCVSKAEWQIHELQAQKSGVDEMIQQINARGGTAVSSDRDTPTASTHEEQANGDSVQTVMIQAMKQMMDMNSQSAHALEMPKIHVRKYNGDPLKFPEWWDQYDRAVHSNPRYDDVARFGHLKSCVVGKALTLVEGWLITSTAYNDAIAMFKERYGRSDVITDHLFTELNYLKCRNDNAGELRQFIDKAEKCIRQLTGMGELNDGGSQSFLIKMILDKMPVKAMETIQLKRGDEKWTLRDLTDSIQAYTTVKEKCVRNSKNNTHAEQSDDESEQQSKHKSKYRNGNVRKHQSTDMFSVSEKPTGKAGYEGKPKRAEQNACNSYDSSFFTSMNRGI